MIDCVIKKGFYQPHSDVVRRFAISNDDTRDSEDSKGL